MKTKRTILPIRARLIRVDQLLFKIRCEAVPGSVTDVAAIEAQREIQAISSLLAQIQAISSLLAIPRGPSP